MGLWASLANMVQQRNLWKGRADSAWGASRVWNSGASFETDSTTWHSRADSAWGANRVWSSGESWEAAYNRVLPLSLSTSSVGLTGPTASQQNVGFTSYTGTFSAPRAGYYMFYGSSAFKHSANTPNVSLRILAAGVQVSETVTVQLNSNPSAERFGVGSSGATFLAAGQTANLQYSVDNGGSCQVDAQSAGWGGGAGVLYYTFVPTQANPH